METGAGHRTSTGAGQPGLDNEGATGSQILAFCMVRQQSRNTRAAMLEIVTAGDGYSVKDVAPDVVLRETVGEMGEDDPTLWV